MTITTLFRKAKLKRNAPVLESISIETTGLTRQEHAIISEIYQLDPWRTSDDRVVISLHGAKWDPAKAIRILQKMDELDIPFVVEPRAYYE